MIVKKSATDFEDVFEKYLRGELTYQELHRTRSAAVTYRVKIKPPANGNTRTIELVPVPTGGAAE